MFNKPTSISKGGHTTTFAYGPDRERWKRTDTSSAGTKTTLYLGSVEKIINPNGGQEIKRYIGGVVIESEIYTSAGALTSEQRSYLYYDHLGSLDVITDEDGAVIQEMSFDVWGARRDANNWNDKTTLTDILRVDNRLTTAIIWSTVYEGSRRGFTGHEMADEVGVIHMNGRIYDPKLGRFLQADTVVDGVGNTQGYNRYGYVQNNPLSYTDPTGHFKLRQWAGTIVGAVVGFATGCWSCGAYIAGAINGVQTVAAGGSIGDGLLVGVSSAALTYAGGQLFPGLGATFGELATYGFQMGMIGGITSVLQGGKFGHGFISAGIGSVVGGSALGGTGGSGGAIAGRIIAKTIIGGTLSKVTGGKFANGAGAAAFGSVMGEIAYANQPKQLKLISPQIKNAVGVSPQNEARMSDAAFVDETPIAVITVKAGTPPAVTLNAAPISIASTTSAPPATLDGDYLRARAIEGENSARAAIMAEQRAGAMAGQMAAAYEAQSQLENAVLIGISAPVLLGASTLAGPAALGGSTTGMLMHGLPRYFNGDQVSASGLLFSGSVGAVSGYATNSLVLASGGGIAANVAWRSRMIAGTYAVNQSAGRVFGF